MMHCTGLSSWMCAYVRACHVYTEFHEPGSSLKVASLHVCQGDGPSETNKVTHGGSGRGRKRKSAAADSRADLALGKGAGTGTPSKKAKKTPMKAEGGDAAADPGDSPSGDEDAIDEDDEEGDSEPDDGAVQRRKKRRRKKRRSSQVSPSDHIVCKHEEVAAQACLKIAEKNFPGAVLWSRNVAIPSRADG